ncbi:MAG: hypothetical protein E7146_05675 [Rikenellaceae bacterium]|nr:hypothetical protein [Rikenellaceae bacterium]
MLYIALLAVVLVLSTSFATAQNPEQMIIDGDTISYTYHADHTPITKKGFGQRLDDYLSLDVNDAKRVNFSITGGPGYSPNRGWQLAVRGDMQYRTRATQTTSTPDRLSIVAAASLTGYYGIKIDGVNHLGKSHNLQYGAELRSEPRDIYGLSFASSSVGTLGTYTEEMYRGWVRYSHLVNNLFLFGAYVDYHYESAHKLDTYGASLLNSQTLQYQGLGLGLSLGLRSARKEAINRIRGVNITIEGLVRPELLSNYSATLWQVSLLLDYYQPLWRGGLMVIDIYGEQHSQNTPWILRGQLGDDARMRGYYPGRYNGNTLITSQLELRQHIINGLVIAAWAGCGTAFSKGEEFNTSMILPNYGVGLRYHLGTHSAIRIDVGFGRDGYDFILGYNEAF